MKFYCDRKARVTLENGDTVEMFEITRETSKLRDGSFSTCGYALVKDNAEAMVAGLIMRDKLSGEAVA